MAGNGSAGAEATRRKRTHAHRGRPTDRVRRSFWLSATKSTRRSNAANTKTREETSSVSASPATATTDPPPVFSGSPFAAIFCARPHEGRERLCKIVPQRVPPRRSPLHGPPHLDRTTPIEMCTHSTAHDRRHTAQQPRDPTWTRESTDRIHVCVTQHRDGRAQEDGAARASCPPSRD